MWRSHHIMGSSPETQGIYCGNDLYFTGTRETQNCWGHHPQALRHQGQPRLNVPRKLFLVGRRGTMSKAVRPISNFSQCWGSHKFWGSFFLTRGGAFCWTWHRWARFHALNVIALLTWSSFHLPLCSELFTECFFSIFWRFFSVAHKCHFDQIREIFISHAKKYKISRSRKWSIISDTYFDCDAKSDINIKSLLW